MGIKQSRFPVLPTHVFVVGQRVRYVAAQSALRGDRRQDGALSAPFFEVLRLLPRAESVPYYRVRDVQSGQEWVVSEREITSFI